MYRDFNLSVNTGTSVGYDKYSTGRLSYKLLRLTIIIFIKEMNKIKEMNEINKAVEIFQKLDPATI